MSEYKRLTENIGEHDYIKCYKRLYELENKIMQGLMVELPCKVGDTMYYLVENNIDNVPYIKKVRVERFSFSDYYNTGNSKLGVYTDLGVISYNDNLFSTKAEAEKKLKELSKNP